MPPPPAAIAPPPSAASDALVNAAFRYQVDGDSRILAETKQIVRDYLDHKIPD